MQKALIDKLMAVGAGHTLFHQKMKQVSTLGEWLCCQGRTKGREADELAAGPRASFCTSIGLSAGSSLSS